MCLGGEGDSWISVTDPMDFSHVNLTHTHTHTHTNLHIVHINHRKSVSVVAIATGDRPFWVCEKVWFFISINASVSTAVSH